MLYWYTVYNFTWILEGPLTKFKIERLKEKGTSKEIIII